MPADCKIGIILANDFFIAQISERNGINKIQKFSRDAAGISSFLNEVSDPVIIEIEDTVWTKEFIQDIKDLAQRCIVLKEISFFSFTRWDD